jgi:hypothetical protein
MSFSPVILSEVVVREADDNAVEGSAMRLNSQWLLKGFLPRNQDLENALWRHWSPALQGSFDSAAVSPRETATSLRMTGLLVAPLFENGFHRSKYEFLRKP